MNLNLFQNRAALGDVRRALRTHKYDMSENGIFVPAMKSELNMGAVYDVGHFRPLRRDTPWQQMLKRWGRYFNLLRFDPTGYEELEPTLGYNIIPLEARNKLLNQFVKNGSAIASQYVALFSGNVTPADTITGATFASVTTEFTSYDESTRVLHQPGTVAAAAVNNNDNKAVFTASSGVSAVSIYGGGVMQHSGKGNTTAGQLCFSASAFASAKVISEAEVLTVGVSYSFTVPA